MRNDIKKLKRIFLLILIFLISINSFAAVVSDNDGSNFITKGEFDSLKQNFQSQIDNYNQSLDNKIDGAIAQYLAGANVSQLEHRQLLYSFTDADSFDTNSPPRYKLGYAHHEGSTGYIKNWNHMTHSSGLAQRFGQYVRFFIFAGVPTNWSDPAFSNPFRKLLVKDIDVTSKICAWVGINDDCREHFTWKIDEKKFNNATWDPDGSVVPGADSGWYWAKSTMGLHPIVDGRTRDKHHVYYDVNGDIFNEWNIPADSTGWFAVDLSMGTTTAATDWSSTGLIVPMSPQSLNTQRLKKDTYTDLFLFKNLVCYEFQNETPTNVILECGLPTNMSADTTSLRARQLANSDCVISGTDATNLWNKNSFGESTTVFWNTLTTRNRTSTTASWPAYPAVKTGYASPGILPWTTSGLPTEAGYTNYIPPVQGFESTGCGGTIDNWNQIYNPNLDIIAEEYGALSKTYNALLKDSDGKYHLSLCAGFPLVKADKNQTVTFVLDSKSDAPLYLWAKLSPFDNVVSPFAETDKSDFLNISGNKGAVFDTTYKCLKTIADNTEITIPIPSSLTDEAVIWLKWSPIPASGNVTDATGGDSIKFPNTVSVLK